MPTTIPNQFQADAPGLTSSIASLGSTFIVANSNSKAAQSSNGYKDPYSIVAGTATNHANVRVIPIPPNTSHVELYHAYDINSATPADPSTQPKVHAFGKLPENFARAARQWPSDVDSTNFPDLSSSGAWIPLVKPSDNTSGQTFGAHTLWHAHSTLPWGMAGPLVFLVAGTTHLIVTVETAGDPATAGLILARFSS